MTLTRWQPFGTHRSWSSLPALQTRMNSIFDEFFNTDNDGEAPLWAPRVDVVELQDKFDISVELPGMNKDDVKLEFEDNMLTISGEKKIVNEKEERNVHLTERHFGSFRRSFRIPAYADTENINAEFTNGILRISLQKREEAKPKQIEISVK